MNEKNILARSVLNFLALFLLSVLVLQFFLPSFSSEALAAQEDCENSRFGCFEVGLPGIKTSTTIDDFAKQGLVGYINIVANVIIGLIIATGLISVVAAGYVYMTAGGDGGKVETAKTMIKAALLGIILALSAFLILNTISPQFASEVQDPLFGTPAP